MTKNLLKDLQDKAYAVSESIMNVIIEMTMDKPLIVFESEDLVDDDAIWELPFGYYVDKHENYNEGRIQKVCGDEVTLFLISEGIHGESHTQTLSEVPYESLVQLLTFLIERED